MLFKVFDVAVMYGMWVFDIMVMYEDAKAVHFTRKSILVLNSLERNLVGNMLWEKMKTYSFPQIMPGDRQLYLGIQVNVVFDLRFLPWPLILRESVVYNALIIIFLT